MTFATAFLVSALRLLAFAPAGASDLSGRILFAGRGVPGVAITATQADRVVRGLTDDDGSFRLPDLDDGAWTIRAEMAGFAPATRDVTLPLAADADPLAIALTMKPYAEIVGAAASAPGGSADRPAPATSASADTPDPVDVITGSLVNGAATPFAQARGFGNNRPRPPSLYNVGVTSVLGNSAWNARPYSFAGSSESAPSYGDLQVGFTIAGPIRIPWLVRHGPAMQLGYEHAGGHHATTRSAVMPTAAERAGDFSAFAGVVRDPLTGQPFPGNVIPTNRISSQAASLAARYPSPNATSATGVNFQAPIVAATSSDQVQFTTNQSWRNRTSLAGRFSFRRSTTSAVNLFGFDDTSRQSSLAGALNLSRQVSSRLVLRARYELSHATTSVTPYFANRMDVSGDAGIAGNDRDPSNWGPPALSFPGLAGLSDAERQRTASTTNGIGGEILLRTGGHNLTIGGDMRWLRVGILAQPNPRGTLTFTGAASGHPFADFLLGLPSASAIALGNSETRLQGISPDAYVNDDWRILATLTLNIGLRWEYDSPFREASGQLVNLDLAPDFSAAVPVLATNPRGVLTGAAYPASLIRPDRRGFQPRLGASWRPSISSPLVIKAAYGLYRSLGGYQPLASLLSQQAPFSRTFNVQNSAATPLTLANPFPSTVPGDTNTFAVDPDVRAPAAHTWQVSMQRELPGSLTTIAAYLGAKGSHLLQAFLPNTYPAGAVNPCPSCPSGFIYVASDGTSRRHAAQFTLRRRLYAGFRASVQYTLATSTDDAATFSNNTATPASLSIAQNWLDLGAERAPSSFDQRHFANAQVQYTTGAGLRGGTLVDGFRGSLWKDWTVAAQMTAGSGLPVTPIAFLPVPGTGVVGVRPSLTGVFAAPVAAGAYASAAAFAEPAAGTWGNAGRNSIRGPKPFSLDMSVARTFRLGTRWNVEWRLAATNVLNRVTFAAIDPVISSPQFGQPTAANPMRALQMTIRLRF